MMDKAQYSEDKVTTILYILKLRSVKLMSQDE